MGCEASLPFAWGGTLEDDQCGGMSWTLLLYYYSVQVLEPLSPKQENNKKRSWRTTISLSVLLDGKTNGQVPQLAALKTGKQRRLPVN